MIPDETVVRDFVCTGQVMPDTPPAVPQYLDPAQVGHILNMTKDMTDISVPDWFAFALPFVFAFGVAFVIWLVDDAGFMFTRLKWWWQNRRAAKRRERACQTCTGQDTHDSHVL